MAAETTTTVVSCSPTGNSAQSCCIGNGDGGRCEQDWDCLGMMSCKNNRCEGLSGCADFCERSHDGGRTTINCCGVEALTAHVCQDDSDCLGARTCDFGSFDIVGGSGVCTGESGCSQAPKHAAGLKVTYDVACLCLGIDNTCLFPDGVPCAQACQYSRHGNFASCSLLEGV